ncbi:MAG: trigger factor [Clostridia bacterium]|nr:trigger factor [Clostridia bacterium]
MLKSSNKTETNVYTLEVTVEAKDFQAAIVKAYNKQKNKIQLPGFRKGKAPLHMVEKFYGKGVFYEDALDIVYPDVVSAAIKEAGLEIVAPPHDVEVKSMDEENGVEMTLKVTVKPEITIENYKGIEANKEDATVTAADVKAELASMQDRNSRVVTVEPRKAKKNDIAVIDFEGFVDGVAFEGGKGENHELTLGSGQFIPGFEDQIIGHKPGDEFDVNVTFPTEYTPELAGKDAVFKVVLHELKVKELPELDDEFAKDVSEHDTLAELKKSIKAELADAKAEEVKRAFESEVLEKVVDLVEGEIPEVMYDTKLDDMVRDYENRLSQQGIPLDTYLQYMGMDREAFKSSMRGNAVKQVKLQLAVDKIAELENITASDDEVEAKLQEMADAYQMEYEQIKKWVNADDVKKDIVGEKTVNFLVDNSKAIVAEKPKKTAKKAAKKEEEKAEDENESEAE